MATDTTSSRPAARPRVTWTTLAAVGAIQHGSFIAAWDLDPELFPCSTQATPLAGYYALFDRIVAGLAAMESLPLFLVGMAAVVAPLVSLLTAAIFLAVPGLVGEGAEVARGYVIDVSDEEMALFDVERRAVRLLPRKGLSWQVLDAERQP